MLKVHIAMVVSSFWLLGCDCSGQPASIVCPGGYPPKTATYGGIGGASSEVPCGPTPCDDGQGGLLQDVGEHCAGDDFNPAPANGPSCCQVVTYFGRVAYSVARDSTDGSVANLLTVGNEMPTTRTMSPETTATILNLLTTAERAAERDLAGAEAERVRLHAKRNEFRSMRNERKFQYDYQQARKAAATAKAKLAALVAATREIKG